MLGDGLCGIWVRGWPLFERWSVLSLFTRMASCVGVSVCAVSVHEYTLLCWGVMICVGLGARMASCVGAMICAVSVYECTLLYRGDDLCCLCLRVYLLCWGDDLCGFVHEYTSCTGR